MTAVEPRGRLVASSDAAATTQSEISAEIAGIARDYEHARATAGARPRPPPDPPLSRSSLLRHPRHEAQLVDPEGAELMAPVFGRRDVDPFEADLTLQHPAQPIGG